MSRQGVLFDIGGVLLDGDQVLPGAIASLVRLREAGIPFLLLTNTTRRSHADLRRVLRDAGIPVAAEHLLTPASLANDWLRHHAKQPYFLIHPGLQADFWGYQAGDPADPSDEPADVVVVGDAGDAFTYAHLNAAFRALMGGAPLVSLSDSRYFREGTTWSLDAGPFVHLLESAANVRAICLGKPGALFFGEALTRLGVAAANVTMIGDDVLSDIQGAVDVGIQGILVETGKYRAGDSARLPPGAQQVSDVAAAIDRILST